VRTVACNNGYGRITDADCGDFLATTQGDCRRLITILLVGLILSACTADPPEARLQDYEKRLFRTLGITPIDNPIPKYARFPAQPTLRKDSPRETIDILDLWSIRECALHGLLAQRNSSLGRVAQPSTRMFYELNFLRLAPECIDTLVQQGKEDLAATLREARSRKEAQLPLVIWQGVLGGGEYQSYWKLPQRLGDYPTANNHASDQALKAIASDVRRWLGKDYRFESAEVEGNLQKLLGGDGGAIYKSAVLQGMYLGRIDTALEKRLREGPICGLGKDTKASILDTVVRKYFVGSIQRWSVQIQARAYQLDAAREVEDLLAGAEPSEFAVWREDRDRVIANALRAPRNHVQTLLPIMRQCGLAPEEQAML
jgi:hypothetical protein